MRRRRERPPVEPHPHTVATIAAAAEWRGKVSEAAANFERRWTLAALQRVDEDVAARLRIQRDLFHEKCFAGRVSEIEQEGAALVRGYAVAVDRCEAAGVDDESYVVGRCELTGLTVAIGWYRAAEARVRELYGDNVTWLTPDDVARMLAGNEAFRVVRDVKAVFPGAELLPAPTSDIGVVSDDAEGVGEADDEGGTGRAADG